MADLKGSKTHSNLKDAFAGESQANRRYLYFAKVADVEGQPDIAGHARVAGVQVDLVRPHRRRTAEVRRDRHLIDLGRLSRLEIDDARDGAVSMETACNNGPCLSRQVAIP